MAFFRCGGNVGKNSLILPDNIEALNIFKDDKRVIIFWDVPESSEIEIEKFNIYYCKAESLPGTLEDFTYYTSVGKDIRTCEITPLENDVNYYFVVESVSVEDYENASLRGSNKACTKDTEIVLSNSSKYYYSKNGIEWTEQSADVAVSKIKYVNDRWISISTTCNTTTSYYQNSEYLHKIVGTLYYSFDSVSWVTVNFTVKEYTDTSTSSGEIDALLDNVEYINGMYAIVSYKNGMILTKDFKEFTYQFFSYYHESSSDMDDCHFYKVGNYIVSANHRRNSLYTGGHLRIFNNDFQIIEDISLKDYGSAVYDIPFLFANYTFGMYFCARGTLYYINGKSGTVTAIAKFDQGKRISSMFVDEKYVYYIQYSTWKWYRALLGDTEFTEIGKGNENFNLYNVITIGDKWIARNWNTVMYSKKDISNWIKTIEASSIFMDTKGGY